MRKARSPTLFELTKQALSSTEVGYDLLAPTFDRSWFRTPDALVEAALCPLLAREPARRALDLGCGTGATFEALLASRVERIVGLDRSAGMLAVARAHAVELGGADRVALVRADLLAPPFVGSFDLATTFGTLGHVRCENMGRFFSGVAAALVPGGRFVFVTARRPRMLSVAHVASRAFNATMHVRNALVSPRFDMFYLTCLVPDVLPLLDRAGFDVVMDALPAASSRLVRVVARKRAEGAPCVRGRLGPS